MRSCPYLSKSLPVNRPLLRRVPRRGASDSSRADTAAPPLEKEPALTTFVKAVYPLGAFQTGNRGNGAARAARQRTRHDRQRRRFKGARPCARFGRGESGFAPSFLHLPWQAASRFRSSSPMTTASRSKTNSAPLIRSSISSAGWWNAEPGRRSAAPWCSSSYLDTTMDSSRKSPVRHLPAKNRLDAGAASRRRATSPAGPIRLAALPFGSLPAGTIKVIVPVPGCENFNGLRNHQAGQGDRGHLSAEPGLLCRLQHRGPWPERRRRRSRERTLTLDEVRKDSRLRRRCGEGHPGAAGVARSAFPFRPDHRARRPAPAIRISTLTELPCRRSSISAASSRPITPRRCRASISIPADSASATATPWPGVVELTGAQTEDRPPARLSRLNLFDASFLLEGPLSDNVSFLVTARRSYIANVLDFFLNKIAKTSSFPSPSFPITGTISRAWMPT